MSLRHYHYTLLYTVALLWSAIVVVSCSEDKSKLVHLDGEEILSAELLDLNVTYTEYGKPKTLLKAPLLQRYLFADEPYSLFPKGLFVQTFDANAQLESQITADYALYKEKPAELWKAVGNVVVVNFQQQQTLTTDTLYWDMPAKSLYTYAYVRIETPDAVINGRNGMVSDERFTDYTIRSVGDDSRYYYSEAPAVADSSAQAAPPPVTQQPAAPQPSAAAREKQPAAQPSAAPREKPAAPPPQDASRKKAPNASGQPPAQRPTIDRKMTLQKDSINRKP